MRRTRLIFGLCVLLVLTCSGLLLSVAQRVRETAAAAKCTVVKGLALAVHCYHDVNGRLRCGPPPPPGVPQDRRLSWIVEALPYAEAYYTYQKFDLTAPADSEQNRAAAATYRYYFHVTCPMAPPPQGRDWPDSPPISNRIGVAGVGADAPELPEKHPRAGAFGYDRRTRMSDGFPDGLSNTFLIVETAHNPATGRSAVRRPRARSCRNPLRTSGRIGRSAGCTQTAGSGVRLPAESW